MGSQLSLSPKKPEELSYIGVVHSAAFSGMYLLALEANESSYLFGSETSLHPLHYIELHKESGF
jgi:hypothetical protein